MLPTSIAPLHPLQSAILEALAERPLISIEDLHKAISSRFKIEVSKPNLYRTVRMLIAAQMLSKKEHRLQLNEIWIANLESFFDKISQRSKLLDTSQSLPSREGTELRIRASSLAELDPSWNNILGALSREQAKGTWYFYNAHPWYSLGSPSSEYRLFRGIVQRGIRLVGTYGTSCFLDSYGAKRIQLDGLRTNTISDNLFPGDGTIVWICGPVTMHLEMPLALQNQFSAFFRSVQTIDEFDPQAFGDVFRMKARCELTVRYSQKESGKLLGKFKSALSRSSKRKL